MLHLVGFTRHSIVYVCPKGLSVYETKFQGLSTRQGYTRTNAEKSWPSIVTYIYIYIYINQYVCVCVCVYIYTYTYIIHTYMHISLVTPFVFLSIGL